MKRKLSLLLAMVLAMTMVMGMNLTALAYEPPAPRPEGCPESVTPCTHSEVDRTGDLLYVYEFVERGVKVAVYDCQNGSYISYFTADDSMFAGTPTLNRVYHRKSGDKYYLCEEPSPTPTPSPEPNGETPSAPSCDHDFQWQTITSATATTYGTEGEVCSKCGATRNVRVKSPLDDWVRMQINNAKPGDVLKVDFGPWNSYPLWMMQMIADKPTVTYIFNYTYQGNKYEVTIKPGDKFALDCDWYGPLKMPTLFDTVITKW